MFFAPKEIFGGLDLACGGAAGGLVSIDAPLGNGAGLSTPEKENH